MIRDLSGDILLQRTGKWRTIEENERIPGLLRGRCITGVLWEHDVDGSGNGLTLGLDNGAILFIDGWGHDWWGTTISEWVGRE